MNRLLINDHVLANNAELTRIRGIGMTKKQWLNSIGIHTLAELAQVLVDDLELQLHSSGHPVSRSEIESWVTSAQALLVETAASSEEFSYENGCSGCQSVELPEIEDEEPQQPIPEIPWNSLATFTIEVQTRSTAGKSEQRAIVHHQQTEAEATEFDLGSTQLHPDLLDWMNDRLILTHPVETPPQPVTVEITQVRSLQPAGGNLQMVADQTHHLFPNSLEASKPFTLQISLHFAGLAEVNRDTLSLVYRTHCQARHLFTGELIDLGEQIATVPANLTESQTATLSELSLPPGAYRLQILATLQNAAATSTCFKVPMLQVV